MEREEGKTAPGASVKSFITEIIVIFIMMVVTYALTFIIPDGHMIEIGESLEAVERRKAEE